MVEELGVEHCAKLSKISLSAHELHEYRAQFQDILGLVGQLHAIDTSSVENQPQENPTATVLREDSVSASTPVEELLKNGPHCINNFFVIPKIL